MPPALLPWHKLSMESLWPPFIFRLAAATCNIETSSSELLKAVSNPWRKLRFGNGMPESSFRTDVVNVNASRNWRWRNVIYTRVDFDAMDIITFMRIEQVEHVKAVSRWAFA